MEAWRNGSVLGKSNIWEIINQLSRKMPRKNRIWERIS